MKLNFSKYQGTGNDFVMLDNMSGSYNDLTIDQIQFLCDRKMGIGADGLIKISAHSDYDFEVEYFNADGSQSFCGNGARCSVSFAHSLGLLTSDTTFLAIDGPHKAVFFENGDVKLEMLPVDAINRDGDDFVVDTGSPHYIRIVNDLDAVDIVELGRSIRYSDKYKAEGINVNTMQLLGDTSAKIATYERGVEDETLSCGTGVTAVALVRMLITQDLDCVGVHARGGDLVVEAEKDGKGFRNIWLTGPATKVFDGSVEL